VPTGPRYTVVVSPRAARALKKIKDRAVLKRLGAAIDGLETDPRPPGVRMLQGADQMFRIRVGEYRILYGIEDRVLVVRVVTLGHRRDVYKGL
jgi:mRNA interferase RelE/StbE